MNAKLGGVRSFLQVSVTDSPAATKGKPVKAVVAKHADKKAAENQNLTHKLLLRRWTRW